MDKRQRPLELFIQFMLVITILLGLLFIYQLGRHLLGGSWGSDTLSVTIIGILTATLMTFGVVLGQVYMKQHCDFRTLHNELKKVNAHLVAIEARFGQMDRRLVRVELTARKD